MPSEPLTWLITGCSSGFGEQFVHQLLARGDVVLASGRSASTKLAHLQNTGAKIFDLDVTEPFEKIDASISEVIKSNGGHVDVLVNNAGYIESGAFEEVGSERIIRSYNTNVFGHVNVTNAVLPFMRARGSGTVAFVGSIAGWKGEPSASAYCSAKFALEGLVESMEQELAMFGLKTIIFEPGLCRTKVLQLGSNLHHPPSRIPAYAQFSDMVYEAEKQMYGKELGDSVVVVRRMIEVITGTGMAAGKGEMPLRVPLGGDALRAIRQKCEATLKLLDKWEDVITSTDIKEPGVIGASGWLAPDEK